LLKLGNVCSYKDINLKSSAIANGFPVDAHDIPSIKTIMTQIIKRIIAHVGIPPPSCAGAGAGAGTGAGVDIFILLAQRIYETH
jgi:hypothetical protein